MNVKILQTTGPRIAALTDKKVVIASAQDALDLMATLRYEYDCSRVILPKSCITESFFDLKTGIAGEILQKYTNYQMKVAIVGEFSTYTSKALLDFMYESNKGTSVFFLPDEAAAAQKLSGV